jgi:hypothetical protein
MDLSVAGVRRPPSAITCGGPATTHHHPIESFVSAPDSGPCHVLLRSLPRCRPRAPPALFLMISFFLLSTNSGFAIGRAR